MGGGMVLVVCSKCLAKISDESSNCFCCDQPVSESQENSAKMSDETEGGIAEYLKLGSPFLFITVLTVIILLIYGLSVQIVWDWPEMVEHWKEIIFSIFFIAYMSVWAIYFSSKIGNNNDSKTCLKSKTLRSLLCKTSLQWADVKNNENLANNLEKSFRRMATSSMQLLGILIAVSFFEIRIVADIYTDPKCCIDNFKALIIMLAGISGFIAFICFIKSVAALNVLFNKFKTPVDRHKIIHYYYQITINPKYYGYASMITGVILIIAHTDLLFGCFAIGITLFVLYEHLFPSIKE